MKILKRIAAVLLVSAALLFCSVPVSAERQFPECIENCRFYDAERVLDTQTAAELSSLIQQTSSEIDMYAAVVILDQSLPNETDEEAEYNAHIRYNDLFNPKDGVDTDGTLLWINLATHTLCIATSGRGMFYYYNGSEDNRSAQMVSNLTPFMRSMDYAGAIRQFCSDLKKYKIAGLPSQAYNTHRDTGKVYYIQNGEIVIADKLPWYYAVNWPVVLGVSGVLGLLTGLISMLCIKSSYKLKKSLSATNYVSQKETEYYQRDDMFLRAHTSKTHISSDSGRSGGGGGGGGSIGSFGGHSGGGSVGHW
ncbi:MAG: TPM domain-containing protein [Oscillospiraceae bacterium]|nr:TPM domain-containing protein [Oscillospiraceae bacterium]